MLWGGFVGESDSAAGFGGAARSIEDANDSDVGVERGEVVVRLQCAVEDSDEVVDGAVERR
jgi:hypothetical protein